MPNEARVRQLVREQDEVNTETLSGDKTLSFGDAYHQRLDPNGSDRTVTAPPAVDMNRRAFLIENTAGAANKLTINDNGGSELATLRNGEMVRLVSDGSSVVAEGVVSPGLYHRDGIEKTHFKIVEDFLGDAGDTPNNPWTLQDRVSATGSQTVDFVTDTADGEIQLKHTANAQAEEASLDWNDHLAINLSQQPLVEMRVKVIMTGSDALGSADQRALFGVGTAYASTLDNVTNHAWFRIEGANDDLLAQTDDGTNDESVDTTEDLLSDNYRTLAIDFADLSDVKFFVDGVRVLSGTKFDMSNVSANTLVQPLCVLQKDGGSEQEDLRVDYAKIVQRRTS